MKNSGVYLYVVVGVLTLISGVYFLTLGGSGARAPSSEPLTPELAAAPASVVQPAPVHVEPVRAFADALQTMAPVTSAEPPGGSFNHPFDVALNCVDNVACEKIAYSTDGTEPDFNGHGQVAAGSRATVRVGDHGDGSYAVRFRGMGRGGQQEIVRMATYSLDTTPPVTTPSSGSGAYDGPRSISLNCTDNLAGCAAITYSLDGDDPDFNGRGSMYQSSSVTIYIGEQGSGTYVLKYRSRDTAGNEESLKAALYEIALPCAGTTISDTGLSPCLRTCGIGANETSEASSDHTACGCQGGHHWAGSTKTCEPN